MARTGYFGATPRAYASLDSTLVAIARQWQQQRADNLMSAWQKGGTWGGQKATDQLVLKFWKDKAAGVDKQDALYDTYHQAYQQLDYSIHESKMTAAYALGKASDAQMIHFYLGWSKKVPKNSEFYRVLQRDAGQYIRNQKAASEAAARQAEEDRYQRQQNQTRKSKEAGAEYIIDVLRRVAQSGYADAGIAAPLSAPGSTSDNDFGNFDPGDPEQMLRLMQVITTDQRGVDVADGKKRLGATTTVGNSDVIFHDDDGKGITGQDIMEQLKAKVPGFDGTGRLDTTFVTNLIDSQMEGLTERIKRAEKTGHMTDVKNLTEAKAYFASVKRQVAAWPVIKSYDEIKSQYNSIVGNPNITPAAGLKAEAEKNRQLTELLNDPRIAADDNLRSRIAAEVEGKGGVPDISESTTGFGAGFDPSKFNDIQDQVDRAQFWQDQIDAVAQTATLPDNDPNKVVWTYGRTEGQGANAHFVAGPGSEVGVALSSTVKGAGGNPQTVALVDPMGGQTIPVTVIGKPVFASITDANGNPVKATNSNPIGYQYSVTQGGKTITSYGYQSADNGFVISTDPPWRNNLPVHPDGDALVADFSAMYNETVGDAPAGRDYGNGLVGAVNRDGKVVVSFNPQDLAASGDERKVAGHDPITDFHSLSLATYVQTSDGMNALKDESNFTLRRQLDFDAHSYAGDKFDFATGEYLPGTGDQNRYNEALGVTTRAQQSQGYEDFVVRGGTEWKRDNTNSAFPTSTTQQAQGSNLPLGGGYNTQMPLPSDALRFASGWSAFGKAFVPGTNKINPGSPDERDQLNIQTIGTVKVPDFSAARDQIEANRIKTVSTPATQTTTQVSTNPASNTQSQGQTSTVPQNRPWMHEAGPGTGGY